MGADGEEIVDEVEVLETLLEVSKAEREMTDMNCICAILIWGFLAV